MNERQPSFKEPGAVTALRPAGCAVAGAGRPGGLNWGGTVTKLTRQSAAARRAGRAGGGGAQRHIRAARPVGAHHRRSEQPSPARSSGSLPPRSASPPERWRRLPCTRVERLMRGAVPPRPRPPGPARRGSRIWAAVARHCAPRAADSCQCQCDGQCRLDPAPPHSFRCPAFESRWPRFCDSPLTWPRMCLGESTAKCGWHCGPTGIG